MNAALGICALLVLLSNLYALSVARKAKRATKESLADADFQRARADVAESNLHAIVEATQGVVEAANEMYVLGNANVIALSVAKTAREHWKSYAIALEVLCECCAEGDGTGAGNARDAIERERDILRFLGEYDD